MSRKSKRIPTAIVVAPYLETMRDLPWNVVLNIRQQLNNVLEDNYTTKWKSFKCDDFRDDFGGGGGGDDEGPTAPAPVTPPDFSPSNPFDTNLVLTPQTSLPIPIGEPTVNNPSMRQPGDPFISDPFLLGAMGIAASAFAIPVAVDPVIVIIR